MKTVYTTERSDGGVDIVVQHRGRSIFWSLVFLACALYSVVDWSTLGGWSVLLVCLLLSAFCWPMKPKVRRGGQ